MNKQDIVKALFEAMNSRDFSKVEPFISDEVSFDFPGLDRAIGKKRVLLVLNIILRKYNELIFDVSDIILQDDKAVAVWTNKGMTKIGSAYLNSGLSLLKFKNEKIIFLSDYFKDTSFANPK